VYEISSRQHVKKHLPLFSSTKSMPLVKSVEEAAAVVVAMRSEITLSTSFS
jgi:hypothetical protein